MKKLIRICTFLTLVATFSVISANAQTTESIRAEIPFAFNIGTKTYDAGTYVMKISRATVGNRITLEGDNKILGIFFTVDKGDTPIKSSSLKFVRSSDDSFYLSKIHTSNRNLTIAGGTPKAKGNVFIRNSTIDFN
jgi:hypothetical protein